MFGVMLKSFRLKLPIWNTEIRAINNTQYYSRHHQAARSSTQSMTGYSICTRAFLLLGNHNGIGSEWSSEHLESVRVAPKGHQNVHNLVCTEAMHIA